MHGSLGWYSAIAGNKKMVLGNNKLSDIMEEPLLKWYFEIFKEALLRDNARFFIIGYGFNDKHINQVIAKAVIKHNLKIYIISPENPQYFRERLIHLPFSNKSTLRKFDKQGIEIWKGVSNFYPHRLRDIFPSDQSETDKKHDLFRSIRNN